MKRLAVIALGLLLAESAASACGNAMYLATDRAARLIADAEAALENNQPQKALSLLPSGRYQIRGAHAEIADPWDGPTRATEKKTPPPLFDPKALQRRIDLLQAVAWMRTGQIGRAQTYFENHAENDGPEIKARRAEALSHDRERTEEAMKLLEELVTADLMPDAFAWRTLGELRLRSKDLAGWKEAQKKCVATAKVRALCDNRGKRAL